MPPFNLNITSQPSVGRRAPLRVLGIDPGLNRTGYAILEQTDRGPVVREGGIIQTNKKQVLADRVCEIATGLRELIAEYQPTVMAIEQIFSHVQNPKTAILMAHARGVILLSAAEKSLPIQHYTPTQIKRLLTGSGKASKEQVQHAIRLELGLKTVLEPNDVADAFAVALCHIYSSRHLGFLDAAADALSQST
jgi:crossover junction endodeoxyribonuclease RuvC